MGRFHRHPDGTVHEHHQRDVGDHTGYVDTGTERVAVLETILAENDRTADDNRADFAAAGVTTVNLMSSPGAGKTTLLKRTITALGEQLRLGVLEGDIATSLDADELDGLGAPVSLVNTSAGFGGECHLDATMVRSGLGRLPLNELDVLIIENVGNLVCPAEFDVGQHARAMVYAVTEGEEKPFKYPVMFHACDVVVVNKTDLLPHLDFDLDRFLTNLRTVNPNARVIQVSARTGDGIPEWCDWLLETRSRSVSMSENGHPETHDHDHDHDGETHSHPHDSHDHEHTEHEHEHDHDGDTHTHPHVHEAGHEDDHHHTHNP